MSKVDRYHCVLHHEHGAYDTNSPKKTFTNDKEDATSRSQFVGHAFLTHLTESMQRQSAEDCAAYQMVTETQIIKVYLYN